jgi:SAM-dependent methyltransferase
MSEILWQLLRGATATRAVGLVAELGVADALGDDEQPVAEIANAVAADPATLDRFLHALATEDVFEEVAPGVYRNTEASRELRRGRPWNGFAQLYGGPWYSAIGQLDANGRKAFDGDFWGWLSSHPDERALFDLAMEDGKERRSELLASLDWQAGETVVDVGGGNGSLLLELFARRAGLRGIVFDLPETVRDEARLGAAGIEFEAGSFFDFVPNGDVYVLGTVLHNWPDSEAAAILRTIRSHAPSGARILVLDLVVDRTADVSGLAWFGLLGLALFGSRERTEAEWRALLDEAGVRIDAIDERLIQATCP